MRRDDREIASRLEMESILREATVCRIGLCDGGVPYIVPVLFGYRDGSLYFHSAPEGRKIDLLKGNSTVCFEIDVHSEVLRKPGGACRWGLRYRSVMGLGDACILQDRCKKVEGLNTIVEHYGGAAQDYADDVLRRVSVIQLRIRQMTGKRSD